MKQNAKQTVSTLPSGDGSLPKDTIQPVPFPGTVSHPSANPREPLASLSRKPRCRVLHRHSLNRCENEALDEEMLVCLKHLKEIARHWQEVVDDACQRFPGLRRILEDGDSD